MTPRPGRGRRHATRLRFRSEGSADYALWGDEREAVEDELDLPEDLRRRMKGWVKEYSDRWSGTVGAWTQEELQDHDRRGYVMSQELQAVLGEGYLVAYQFNTAQVRREVRGSSRASRGD
jgi:hypothetical protein